MGFINWFNNTTKIVKFLLTCVGFGAAIRILTFIFGEKKEVKTLVWGILGFTVVGVVPFVLDVISIIKENKITWNVE